MDSCCRVDGASWSRFSLQVSLYESHEPETHDDRLHWDKGGIIRCSLAIERASRELLKLEPVTMSLAHPTCRARPTTPARSSSCLCFPLYTPLKIGSARLIPIWGRSGHSSTSGMDFQKRDRRSYVHQCIEACKP